MIRVLLFLAVLVALAIGEAWLIEQPGELVLHWHGYRIETSVLMGLSALILGAVLLAVLWRFLRFIFNLPSLVAIATRGSRREKGYAALSRGMVAVGAGDPQTARRAASEANRLLPGEPLTLLLKAQAAQLCGESGQAETTFKEMAKRNDMRLLGLRGLHIEADRKGDPDEARRFAEAARAIAPLPWASAAEFDHKTAAGDWRGALALLEGDAGAKGLDKGLRERQRAVLETAMALEKADAQPAEALTLARSALKRAPDFIPAVALAARLTGQTGDRRKAAKMIESAWGSAPHPDLAKVYMSLYPGDSGAERLKRALSLAQLAPRDAESKILVAETAIEADDLAAGREALQPLIDGPERPTARVCRLMAELEDKQHGAAGYVREWLTRASHAPRDPIWVADGVVSEKWRPISPVTGRLDAFVWRTPVERLRSGEDAEDAIFAPLPSPQAPLLLEEPQDAATTPRAGDGASEPEPPATATTPAAGAQDKSKQPEGLANLFDTKAR